MNIDLSMSVTNKGIFGIFENKGVQESPQECLMT